MAGPDAGAFGRDPAEAPVDRRFFGVGVRAAFALPAWIVGFSFLGVGSLARDAGHPLGAALASTIFVWAAPAQLILFGTLASGGLVLAAALAVGLSAIRLMPMVMSVWPYLRRPGMGLGRQVLLAHLIAATTWIESMRRLPELPPPARLPFFLGFGSACLCLSFVMTGLGFVLVGALPPALAAGLLCLTPIYFGVSMIGSARTLADGLAVLFGFALLPVAQRLVGTDFDLLVTGLAGGTAAYGIGRTLRRRQAARGVLP